MGNIIQEDGDRIEEEKRKESEINKKIVKRLATIFKIANGAGSGIKLKKPTSKSR